MSERAAGTGELAVTFFADHAAKAKSERHMSLSGLAEVVEQTSAPRKDALPWLKFARFGTTAKDHKGCLRHDGNVVSLTGAVADYDGEEMSPEQAAERLDKAGIHAIVYTSPSHNDAAPRWRACCPFSEELPPGRHYQMVSRLNGLLGGVLASESFTLSQAYYYGSVGGNPAHRAIVVEGLQYLDQANELDKIAVGKPNGGGRKCGSNDPEAPIEDIRAALEVIPNPLPDWDLNAGTWNEWNIICMAVWRASGGSEEGFAAFDLWSANGHRSTMPGRPGFDGIICTDHPPIRSALGRSSTWRDRLCTNGCRRADARVAPSSN